MSSNATKSATEKAAVDEVAELLQRAARGDRAVLPQLREWLDANPAFWQKAGDVAQVAEEAWVGLVAGGNLVNAESVRRKLAGLREELAGPLPSPLEQLLVQRVVLCWLQASFADASYVHLGQKGCNDLRVYKAAEQRQERAQRRLVAAAKVLATVRKLLNPKPRPECSPLPPAARSLPAWHHRFAEAAVGTTGWPADHN